MDEGYKFCGGMPLREYMEFKRHREREYEEYLRGKARAEAEAREDEFDYLDWLGKNDIRYKPDELNRVPGRYGRPTLNMPHLPTPKKNDDD